ncbi:MAG TPA: hypothetical protein VH374_09055 [Polyangia bacterium]|jgi:hypothetical protein|nr:hypothetical protein [Polyangia bacterium]
MTVRLTKPFHLTPSIVVAILGGWLSVSAIAWQHSFKQRLSCVFAGLTCIVLSGIGRRHEGAHRVSLAVGAWILMSLFVIWPGQSLTAWNNLLIGMGISALATMEPDRPLLRRRRT